MAWITIAEAAEERRVTQRQIWRLIRQGKLAARQGPDHRVYVRSAREETTPTPYVPQERVDIPLVNLSSITPEVMNKIDLMMTSIGFTHDIVRREAMLARETGLTLSTQQHYKTQLRRLYNLPKSIPISRLVYHGQIRQVIEWIVVRKKRSDSGTMRTARDLLIVNDSGQSQPLSEWLRARFATGRYTATACARRLVKEAHEGRVRNATTLQSATTAELPAIRTVTGYLHEWNAKHPAQKAAFTRRLLRHRRRLFRCAQRYVNILNKVLEDLLATGCPIDVRIEHPSEPDGTPLPPVVTARIRRRGGKRKRDQDSAQNDHRART